MHSIGHGTHAAEPWTAETMKTQYYAASFNELSDNRLESVSWNAFRRTIMRQAATGASFVGVQDLSEIIHHTSRAQLFIDSFRLGLNLFGPYGFAIAQSGTFAPLWMRRRVLGTIRRNGGSLAS